MWATLQTMAFLLDKKGVDTAPLMVSLKVLLPCKYCRESYVTFYDELQAPQTGRAALWLYGMHKMVNRKLARQRIKKALQGPLAALVAFKPENDFDGSDAASVEASQAYQLLESAIGDLIPEPSFEVVYKRFVVNGELCWSNITTVLLALAMNYQEAYVASLKTFLGYLVYCVKLTRQHDEQRILENLAEFLRQVAKAPPDGRTLETLAVVMKYSSWNPVTKKIDRAFKLQDARARAQMIRAGQCASGSCV